MKSKLMTMIWVGTLAFGALAPSAMARISGKLPPVNKGSAVSKTAVNKAAAAETSKVGKNTNGRSRATSSHAAVPPHTILPSAKKNPF